MESSRTAACDAVLLFRQSAPESTTYAAFETHCREVRGFASATCKPAQRLFLELFFPSRSILAHFPPRTSYLKAFVKKYCKAIEDAGDDGYDDDEADDGEELEESNPYEDLQVCYAHLCAYLEADTDDDDACRFSAVDWRREYAGEPSVLRFQKRVRRYGWEFGDMTPCFKVFLHAGLKVQEEEEKGQAAAIQNKEVNPTDVVVSRTSWQNSCFAKELELEDVVGAAFFPIRVSTSQFGNVGLALWPSAFVLAQLLTQAFSDGPGSEDAGRLVRLDERHLPANTDPQRRLRILELGAGVGLTAIALHPLERFHHAFEEVLLSDYLESAINNIRFNLLVNGLIQSDESANPTNSGEKRAENSIASSDTAYRAVCMDWTEHGKNAALLSKWKCDVILAADCVYDVSCIPALAKTIHQALQHAPADGPATCILVQNHRQEKTIHTFFDAIRPFAVTQSYQVMSVSKSEIEECNASVVFDSAVRHRGGSEEEEEEDDENSSCPRCVLVPVKVDENGNVKQLNPTSVTSPIRASWIGPYWLEMRESTCVHVISLKPATDTNANE